MADVFISYSHRDSDYAHRLADELRCHQIDVWINDRIDYGDEWPRTIQQNLIACQTFIVIMSTNAFNSVWVQNEVSYAQANHKTIFPLLLEGEVWLSMSAVQYVDVRAGELPPSRFYEKVRESLEQREVPVRRAVEISEVQPARQLVSGAHQGRKGIFLAGSILVFVIIALLQLTDNPADDGAPTFSSIGDRVVFHSNRDGNWEIYSVYTDGSGLVRLTENPANDEFPCWSPDGKLIAFGSDRDGDYEIYVMKIDGSGVVKLTENIDSDHNPTW